MQRLWAYMSTTAIWWCRQNVSVRNTTNVRWKCISILREWCICRCVLNSLQQSDAW